MTGVGTLTHCAHTWPLSGGSAVREFGIRRPGRFESGIADVEAGMNHYALKKAAIVLTLSSLIVIALWALGLLRVGGPVVY